jgi:hypothetical protein
MGQFKSDMQKGQFSNDWFTHNIPYWNEIFEKYQCGTISIFRNHSKVYAGKGEKYAFAIESSANINTNPRTEQTCITIGDDIYQFYKDYYSKIVSFEK